MAFQRPFSKLSLNPVGGVGSTATSFGLMAASFPGTLGVGLVTPSNPSLQGGETDLTFAAWVYLTDLSLPRVILAKDDNQTTAGSEYYMGFYPPYGSFVMQVEQATTQFIVSSLGTPALNTWYFVVGWFDKTAGTVNIQVNNGAVDTLTGLTNATHITNTPLTIGSDFDVNTGLPGGNFAGNIRSVGFWKRVLSSGERTALYNAVGFAYVITTASYIGTMQTNSWAPTVPYQFGQGPDFSAFFDGVGIWATLGGTVNFNAGASISFWFNVNTGGFTGNPVLLGESSNNFTVIQLVSNQTAVRIGTSIPGTTKDFTFPTIVEGIWYNLIVTRDLSNNTHVYLNGIESASGGQSQTDPIQFDQIARYTNGIFGEFFNGAMCELNVWMSYLLTPADIKSLSGGGSAQGAPDLYFKMHEGSGTVLNNYQQIPAGVPLNYDGLPTNMQNEGQDNFPAWWDLDELSGVRRNKRQEALPGAAQISNDGLKTIFQASDANGASINIPPGVGTPNVLANGDLWIDGPNLKIFIGGVVKTFTLT